MMPLGTGRRLRLAAGAAALLILLTACGSPSSEPPAPATSTDASAAPDASPSAAPTASDPAAEDDTADAAPTMPASAPVSVSIASIGLDAQLIHTGKRDDGTLEVPPGDEGAPASWYDGSPTPGERGVSVLLGQVNSTVDESGVFFGLASVAPGDEVVVAREDGTSAVFSVDRIESFAKDTFPTRDVYAPTPDAQLRLITCDSPDGSRSSYPNNLIVFATLVDAR